MPDRMPHRELLAERQAGSPTGFRNLFFHHRVLRAGWGILLFVFLGYFILAVELWAVVASGHRVPAPHLVVVPRDVLTPFLILIAVAIATLVPSFLEQRHVTEYGMRGSPWRGLGAGVVVSAVLVLPLLYSLRAAKLMLPMPGHAGGALQLSVTWAGYFAIGSLLENLLTRGYLQFTLTRGLAFLYRRMLGLRTGIAAGFWTAALMTSLLYSMLYSNNPGHTRISQMSIFGTGLLYCLSLWRTGSLWWAIGFQTAWDFVQGYLYGLWSGGTPIRDHFWLWIPLMPGSLSGGKSGLNGSYLVAAAIVLAALSLLLLPSHQVYPELWKSDARQPEHDGETLPDPDRI